MTRPRVRAASGALRRWPSGRVTVVLVLAAVLLASAPAGAYLHLTTSREGGVGVKVRWDEMPVHWFVSMGSAAGVTATDLQAAVGRAFDTWQAVPTADVSFEFGGFTTAEPGETDGTLVLGFLDEPDMDRVLAATAFLIDSVTGSVVEADVFFNAAFPWSVAPDGDQVRFDLESVAVHEIGHVVGLGHSALGETQLLSNGRRRVNASGSVMFPVSLGTGNILDRELQPDDIAGVSDLYPAGGFRATTGIARGRVRHVGRGVLGAHVIAFNPRTGTLIAGFSLTENGEFEIAGLTPGPHVIRVEPLDDADVAGFFDVAVDVDFGATFFHRHVAVPAGGVARRFDVTVRSK